MKRRISMMLAAGMIVGSMFAMSAQAEENVTLKWALWDISSTVYYEPLITAYEDTGSACANGNYPSVGYTVAHNTLPFGTKIYIEDVGERVVEDRGPGRFGSEWCDIYLGDSGECNAWGMQYKDVYLIEE